MLVFSLPHIISNFCCFVPLLDAVVKGLGLQLQGLETGRIAKQWLSSTFMSQFLGAWWDEMDLRPICQIEINSEFSHIVCGKNSSLVVHLGDLTLHHQA